jgi:hypothetical protein
MNVLVGGELWWKIGVRRESWSERLQLGIVALGIVALGILSLEICSTRNSLRERRELLQKEKNVENPEVTVKKCSKAEKPESLFLVFGSPEHRLLR